VVVGLAAIAAVALAGCGTTPAPLRSDTPTIPTSTGTASEKQALLTTADLRAIPGAPAGIEADPSGGGNTLYRDPNQIGPCGEKLPLPVSSSTAVRPFDSATLEGFQVIVDLPVATATAFVTAWQKDTRPGCPASRSVTNTGSTQTQSLVSSLSLPTLVDQASGALLQLSTMGHTFDTYALVFRTGGRLEVDALIATRPLSAEFGNGFVTEAEKTLNSSMGIHSSSA
jgi:hypothetical protein